MINFVDWAKLRSVGASLPARLTILFPLIANIIIFNDTIVKQFSGKGVLIRDVPGLADQFDLYLWCTFSGLLIFSFGELIYSLMCPNLVKRYSEAETFIASLKSGLVSKSMLLSWARIAESSPHISSDEKAQEGLDSAISLLEGKALVFPEMNEQLINISRMYYKSKNLEFPVWRMVCASFFGVGLCFIFFPTMKTIFKAFKLEFLNF